MGARVELNWGWGGGGWNRSKKPPPIWTLTGPIPAWSLRSAPTRQGHGGLGEHNHACVWVGGWGMGANSLARESKTLQEWQAHLCHWQ